MTTQDRDGAGNRCIPRIEIARNRRQWRKEEVILGKDIESSVLPLIGRIRERMSTAGPPFVVAICGGSSTGKSTVLTDSIRRAFPDQTSLIAQDHFQFLNMGKDEIDPVYGLDHYLHYGVDQCSEMVSALRSGLSVASPQFDFRSRTHQKPLIIHPKPIVLVEGLFSAFRHLRESMDLVVYLESYAFERLIRRLFRNIHERYAGLPIDGNRSIRGFLTRVLNAHRDFVTSQKQNADLVFRNPIHFSRLIDRFQLKPIVEESPITDITWSRPFGKSQCLFRILSRGDRTTFQIRWVNRPYFNTPIGPDTAQRIRAQDWLEC